MYHKALCETMKGHCKNWSVHIIEKLNIWTLFNEFYFGTCVMQFFCGRGREKHFYFSVDVPFHHLLQRVLAKKSIIFVLIFFNYMEKHFLQGAEEGFLTFMVLLLQMLHKCAAKSFGCRVLILRIWAEKFSYRSFINFWITFEICCQCLVGQTSWACVRVLQLNLVITEIKISMSG